MAEAEPIRPIPCPRLVYYAGRFIPNRSLEKSAFHLRKNIVFREIIKLQNKRLGVRIIPVCYFIEELGVALEDICIISLFTFYKLQFDETEIYGFLG